MSALGHKRTFGNVRLMSALTPKADIRRREWDVRFVPQADKVRCSRDWVIRSPRQRPLFAPSLQLIGNLVDAGLGAGFILVATWRAGNPDGAEDIVAYLDRQRALGRHDIGQKQRTGLRVASGLSSLRTATMRS